MFLVPLNHCIHSLVCFFSLFLIYIILTLSSGLNFSGKASRKPSLDNSVVTLLRVSIAFCVEFNDNSSSGFHTALESLVGFLSPN